MLSAEQIVTAAIQEDVDLIGLSLGGRYQQVRQVMDLLKQEKIENKVVIAGGTIPREDIPLLEQMGITAVFPPGSCMEEIVDYTSDSLFRFFEMKIPLSELELQTGGNISVKLFSSQIGKPGAADSIPSDEYTSDYGDEESWLTLPEPINIIVNQTTGNIAGFQFIPLFTILPIIVVIIVIQNNLKRKRKNK